jgi:Uma2 family endonuclease
MVVIVEERAKFFESVGELEGYKVELLRGDIVMTRGADATHNLIVTSITDQVRSDRWQRLQLQAVAIPGEDSEPRPDLVVFERGALRKPATCVPASVVTMVVEVVAGNTLDRDHNLKRSIYAAGKVPTYLIVDPLTARCLVLTEPVGVGEEADYRTQRTWRFGESVPIDALGLELETGGFQTLS